MVQKINCPHCQRLLQLPATYQGGKVRCPGCQGILDGMAQVNVTAAPFQAPAPPITDTEPDEDPEPAPRRRRRPSYADDEVPRRLAAKSKYRPSGAVGIALKTLLGLNLLLSVVMLASDFIQYRLALRLVAGDAVAAAEIDGNDARQLALGIVHLVVFITTGIVFIIWFYRAHANLKPLGATGLTYTSTWAAGGWFVPFLNLVRPVQIAQEIWRNSDPEDVMEDYVARVATGNSLLVGLWWAFYLISNVIANITMSLNGAVNSPETLKTATAVDMIGELAAMISAGLALALVFAIDSRQAARARALEDFADER